MVDIISAEALAGFGGQRHPIGDGVGLDGRVKVDPGKQVEPRRDEVLIGHHRATTSATPSATPSATTYNRQGQLTDSDNHGRQRDTAADYLGHSRHLTSIPSSLTRNKNASTVTKIFDDGTQRVYRFNSQRDLYLASPREGIQDSLSRIDSGWLWVEGSTGMAEYYDARGKLVQTRDANDVSTHYYYRKIGGWFNQRTVLSGVTDSSGRVITIERQDNECQDNTTLQATVQHDGEA